MGVMAHTGWRRALRREEGLGLVGAGGKLRRRVVPDWVLDRARPKPVAVEKAHAVRRRVHRMVDDSVELPREGGT